MNSLQIALDALKENHEWHCIYDNDGSYSDSQLYFKNINAIQNLESLIEGSFDFEELLGAYWSLAYSEGKYGESHGSAANEILSKLRSLCKIEAMQSQSEPIAWMSEPSKVAHKVGDRELYFSRPIVLKSDFIITPLYAAPVPSKPVVDMNQLDILLGEYWDCAILECVSGILHGNRANIILHGIRKLVCGDVGVKS